MVTIKKVKSDDRIIALAGNPNVGKSTVFNALTGMNQHTGNWPGKTVATAQGRHQYQGNGYVLVDLPGTYSLMAHSAEEEVARDFILSGEADATIVVCDATCLERNLNLVIQVMELTDRVVVCVNLLDEAKKKGIKIDLEVLARELGVPVVGTSARSGKGLNDLMEKVEAVCQGTVQTTPRKVMAETRKRLAETEITEEQLSDLVVTDIVLTAQEVAAAAVMNRHGCGGCCSGCGGCGGGGQHTTLSTVQERERKLDRILTSKQTGIPIMLLLLCGIFWLTITGANYPSQLLAQGLFWVQDRLSDLFFWLNAPVWLHGILVLGVYRVLAWVVSVMLPPMAIFFPMFTLLEDFGYLPRVAFNLDYQLKKAKACGKQALTMCMGFGCNAAGVTGCRIIDSPRERLIAILTNNFVPCNGRFPTLIAIITMFFVGTAGGTFDTVLSALILTGVILLGVMLTFWVSRLLSKTILKGEASSFALELPPYRTPQLGKVIVRSIFDRTLFVLGRAVAVAAPAGLVIWLLANITVGDLTLLAHVAGFLDPFARLLGMDGVILLAFILGFPANEIVIPIMIMAYLSTGTILEFDSLSELKALLIAHGWTWVTAVSTMLFCLIHWPCSTTCWTIKKETGSMKWTLISIAIPTVIGMLVCFIFATTARLFGAG